MLDASVLLSATLLPESPSASLVELADESVFLLSPHVERMALQTLRFKAPERLGEFGDAIVRLSMRRTVDRTPKGDSSQLGSLKKGLSGEDAQVLADAMHGGADFLYTHDEKFFRNAPTRPVILTPSAHTWNPLAAGNPYIAVVERDWTFLGFFHPNWDSGSLRGTDTEFSIFEISSHLRCVYIPARGRFEVWLISGDKPLLHLSQPIQYQQPVFVACTAKEGLLVLYVDRQVAQLRTTLPRALTGARLIPFNNARGTSSIFGVVTFRLENRVLDQRIVNRHCRTRSVLITDGEYDFANLVTQHPLLHTPPRSRR